MYWFLSVDTYAMNFSVIPKHDKYVFGSLIWEFEGEGKEGF